MTVTIKDLLYNLDSTTVTYGEHLLTSAIQADERINDIIVFFKSNQFNDYEKTETASRLQKIIDLNRDIRFELEKQERKIAELKDKLLANAVTHHF